MHIVSAILRRSLLQHRPIAVEGIGTLHTVRSEAQFLPGQRLAPPRRMPELVMTEAGDLPLTELVAAELGADPVTAGDFCREWREAAYALALASGLPEGSILLEGIGTIQPDPEQGAEFYADPELLELLNPLPADPLMVPSPSHRAAVGSGSANPTRPDRSRPPRIRPKGKNPHNYTVSFFAVLVVLAALGYLCYYLWAHTDLLAGFLPR